MILRRKVAINLVKSEGSQKGATPERFELSRANPLA